MKLWIALTLALFLPAAHANKMDRFLAGTAWCFADTTGPWDHGRFRFTYEPRGVSTAVFDVTDAPAPGHVVYGWDTLWTLSGYYRLTLWANNRPRVTADIEVQENGNKMVWYWLEPGLPRSTLRRCF